MNKKMMIILIAIISVIILFSSIILITNKDKTENENAEIMIDSDDIRVGEEVRISVKGCSTSENVTIDLGDGVSLYGQDIKYSYEKSGYYDIRAYSGDSRIANKTILVLNMDSEETFGEGPISSLRATRTLIRGLNHDIDSCPVKPDWNCVVEVTGLTGNIVIQAFLWDHDSGEMVYENEQSYSGIQEDITYRDYIDKDSFPEISDNSYFQIEVQLEEARIEHYQITSILNYQRPEQE